MEKRETTILNLLLQFLDPKRVTFKNLKRGYFEFFSFFFSSWLQQWIIK